MFYVCIWPDIEGIKVAILWQEAKKIIWVTISCDYEEDLFI